MYISTIDPKENMQDEQDHDKPENEEPVETTTVEEAPVDQSQEEILRERDQFRALAQRIQADFVNYKRRMDEERQGLVRNASVGFIQRLLPAVDDFQLAIEHLPAEAEESWANGMQMVLRKFRSTLESEGVTPFEPEIGTLFDPAEHEAVFYEPTGEHPSGSIVTVFRRGYNIYDKVLRPAQVTVAQAQEDEPTKDE
jgi:molecular chaperone GrpE